MTPKKKVKVKKKEQTEGDLIIQRGIGVMFSWVKVGGNHVFSVNPKNTGIQPRKGDLWLDDSGSRFFTKGKWKKLK